MTIIIWIDHITVSGTEMQRWRQVFLRQSVSFVRSASNLNNKYHQEKDSITKTIDCNFFH